MEADLTVVFVVAIFFLSTLVRATLGFGDALIAMPLAAMVLGIKTAVPLVAFFGLLAALVILVTAWREIKFAHIYKLIVSAIIGIPIGLIYLKEVNESVVKIVLALILISFSVFRLLEKSPNLLKSDKSSYFFGVLSGILGGAYNTNGPPIIVYGTLRGWSPQVFRSYLQGIFFPTNFFIVLGHGAAGLWNFQLFEFFLMCLPGAFAALIIGSKLNKAIPREKFVKYVYYALIIISVMLIWNSV